MLEKIKYKKVSAAFIAMIMVITLTLSSGVAMAATKVDTKVDETTINTKVYDDKTTWTKDTVLDIFGGLPEGTVGPNSKGTYKFNIQKDDLQPVDFKITTIGENTGNLPLEFRMYKKDEQPSDTWSKIDALPEIAKTMEAQGVYTYLIDWKWVSAGQSKDTELGKLAVDNPLTCKLKVNITFTKEEIKDQDVIKPDGNIDKSGNDNVITGKDGNGSGGDDSVVIGKIKAGLNNLIKTGDLRSLGTAGVIGVLALVGILLLFFSRKKKEEEDTTSETKK